jgi:pyruvate dehydrogenase E2 component (dihydrolipoyllysine-residue acetyltransferase)
MPTDVIMPALGMAQDTGKVLRWLKSEGDAVAKGEPVVEVETDKVTVEVEAPAAGTLGTLRAREGEDVPVGQVVALILGAGEREDGDGAPARPPAAAAPPAPGPAQPAAAPDGRPRRRPPASPKARRVAAARGVDVATLVGTGPGGAVVAADVEAAASAPARAEPSPGPAPAPVETSSVWRAMARHTAESWREAPHFYLRREVDATRLLSWREVARALPGCEALTPTDLLVKVSAEALRRHPEVNVSWSDAGIVAAGEINVAVAVATEAGLVAPVVHRADTLELPALVARRREVVAAAREGRLRLEDVSGGTFTVSNLGMHGVDSFDAIVNGPQAAILAVGRVRERVVPVDGVPAVRPVLALTLSFDHRAVDGAGGARFLDTLAALLEEPAGMVR